MEYRKEQHAHLNPAVIPMRPGTWPIAMLSAEPVMKPLIAGKGMNSTSQPKHSQEKKKAKTVAT